MRFKVNEAVVYAASGIGRIAGLVTQRFHEPEAREYYEVVTGNSTVWVAVDGAAENGLRRLTGKNELGRYRDLLRSAPTTMVADARQRRQDLVNRLRPGTFASLCEVVRDLTAMSWRKPLNEADSVALRRTRDSLAEEWSAAANISLQEANDELTAVLGEARAVHATPDA
jgi:RNA polymerase-interacting CarD/CdnL/TRCF family regulator